MEKRERCSWRFPPPSAELPEEKQSFIQCQMYLQLALGENILLKKAKLSPILNYQTHLWH